MKNKNNVEYCGVLVSERGAANNRVDSGTLKEIIGGVLADDIVQKTGGVFGDWKLVNGDITYYMDSDGNIYNYDEAQERIADIEDMIEMSEEDADEDLDENPDVLRWEDDIKCLETEYYYDIYSYYMISKSKAKFLMDESDEIVLYNSELNMYVWGITYCNISGDDVLTSIRISDNQAA